MSDISQVVEVLTPIVTKFSPILVPVIVFSLFTYLIRRWS